MSVPKQQPDGSTAIDHRYGIEVELTPEVLGGKVQLAFHGRLSELDPAHSVQLGKQTFPGIRMLEIDTRAEMKNGQTLVLQGPTQTHTETYNSGVPYVSEIPFVGAVFRSAKETKNELATIILVRPEIMQSPAAPASPIVSTKNGLMRRAPCNRKIDPALSIHQPPAVPRRAIFADRSCRWSSRLQMKTQQFVGWLSLVVY